MTTKKNLFVALFVLLCIALPAIAQQSPAVTRGPIVIKAFKHDTGPLLREIQPLLPEFSTPSEHEIENLDNPNNHWGNVVLPDPVLQTAENSPSVESPSPNIVFDGLGNGSMFFCNCEPPDNDGAPGTNNQYVQYINTAYAVFSKTGTILLGPLTGNSFWSGFGGSCQSDNSGDPIVRFDAMAQRWVVSQFAINRVAPDFECVAVSQTSDATGAYNRYAFSFNNFPDYPKMAVWPDAYYFTFNNFNIAGTAYVGANACAADRSKMLTGAAATLVCFQQSSANFGELPSDLDGPTLPASGTPNFVMELDPSGSANLDLFKFHVDFAVPANSTFTGPTLVPVAAFTPLCNSFTRGRCVPQPGTGTDLLESLGNRLMFRLVYRNFGDHSTLLASHSIIAGSGGGIRWYEMRNPETGVSLFQSGTFAPDNRFRWMPAIAMDKNQDIGVGYSLSSAASGDFPSLVYNGRTPADPAGTLETEVVMKSGLGSQTSPNAQRWGDYSAMAIDPSDDCTFWFSEQYQKVNGGFDWSTSIGSFTFPGCGGGGGQPQVSLSTALLNFKKGGIGVTSAPLSVTLTNTGTATLNISSVTTTGDFAVSSNTCGATVAIGANCAVGVTFTATKKGARNGTLAFNDNAPNTPQNVTLKGTGQSIVLSPTSLNFGSVAIGVHSSSQPISVHNAGTATVSLTAFTFSGGAALDYSVSTNTCGATIAAGASCSVSIVFTPSKAGNRNANFNVKNNGGGGSSVATMTGVGH